MVIKKVTSSTEVTTYRIEKRISLSRIAKKDFEQRDTKIFSDATWRFSNSSKPRKHSENREKVLKVEKFTNDEIKKMHTLQGLELHKSISEYNAKLPKVELPNFKTDKHVIKYFHELMYEGDTLKVEAALLKLTPNSWYEDKKNGVFTLSGADYFNDIVQQTPYYSTYYCKAPQIKTESYGKVQFITRDLFGAGLMAGYKSKDGSWKINDVRTPTFVEGVKDKDASLKAAGDNNCGTPLSIEIPAGPVVYKIGDRVLGLVRGKWH